MTAKIVALVSLFTLFSFAHAGTRIDKIASQLNTTLQCTNRIWPGLNKESYRVLFVQPSTSESWFWAGSSGKVEPVGKSEFPLDPAMPKYSFGEFRSEKVVILNLDEVSEKYKISALNVDGAVGLAVHEGFHYLFQMKEPWVAQFTSAERKADLDYANAVYLRRMLIGSLKSELLEGKGFGRSAFWFQKWEALGEAPETKFSDILEGTANYVEIISSIFADQGCQISEEKLLQIATSHLDSVIGMQKDAKVAKELFSEYIKTGYQIEGYEIGLLSLLAMRKSGLIVGSGEYEMGRDFVTELQTATTHTEMLKVMADMQMAVAKVRTPAEMLLRNVNPVADQDDLNLLDFIKKLAAP